MPKCPVCGQSLPKAIDEKELHTRLEQITAKGRAEERWEAERQFRKRLDAQREQARRMAEREAQAKVVQAQRRAERAESDRKRDAERMRRENEHAEKRARRAAELKVRKELREANQRAERAERDMEQIRRNAEREAKREAAEATRKAERGHRNEIAELELKRQKDHARHEADRARMQSDIDRLSRKLEKQGAEQLGKEAEIDLLGALNEAFRQYDDQITRVAPGVKGADIIHKIVEDGEQLGCIVYESKNHSTWKNDFVHQAKQYQSQYDTKNVLIVSRTFPRKQKGLCTVKNIPVVDPRMAVYLASIIRDGIKEIALAKMTATGREKKSRELYDYILSDRFVTRFREIAESVDSLREQQRKEKDRHEDVWHEQSTLYDKIDSRRREVDSQIRSIVKAAGNGRQPRALRVAPTRDRLRQAASSLTS